MNDVIGMKSPMWSLLDERTPLQSVLSITTPTRQPKPPPSSPSSSSSSFGRRRSHRTAITTLALLFVVSCTVVLLTGSGGSSSDDDVNNTDGGVAAVEASGGGDASGGVVSACVATTPVVSAALVLRVVASSKDIRSAEVHAMAGPFTLLDANTENVRFVESDEEEGEFGFGFEFELWLESVEVRNLLEALPASETTELTVTARFFGGAAEDEVAVGACTTMVDVIGLVDDTQEEEEEDPLLGAAAATEEEPQSSCGTDADLLRNAKIHLSPFPLQKGADATIDVSGDLDETVRQGSMLELSITLGPVIRVLDKTFDLCEMIEGGCPLAAGPFHTSFAQKLPPSTPNGHYNAKAVLTDDTGAELACITMPFQVTDPPPSQ